MNKETDQRLEEYKFLRVELEAIWGQTYTTVNFMLAAIGVMIALAYNSPRGDPAILLPMASFVTLGGYRLIRIHTTRVWRIVGYMRCSLEAKLEGIRWETRLAKRHLLLKGTGRHKFDHEIFDGHSFLLDCMNIALFVGIACAELPGKYHSEFLNTLASCIEKISALPGSIAKILAVAIPLAVPSLVLIWSGLRRTQLKRGGAAEIEHLQSWLYRDKETQTRMAEEEPPQSEVEWREYLKASPKLTKGKRLREWLRDFVG